MEGLSGAVRPGSPRSRSCLGKEHDSTLGLLAHLLRFGAWGGVGGVEDQGS